jgi:hypothetical protein
VPFDPADVQNFKLDEVPTLTTVINELGQLKKPRDPEDVATVPSLEPYIELFKKHIKKCVIKQEKASKQAEFKAKNTSMDF